MYINKHSDKTNKTSASAVILTTCHTKIRNYQGQCFIIICISSLIKSKKQNLVDAVKQESPRSNCFTSTNSAMCDYTSTYSLCFYMFCTFSVVNIKYPFFAFSGCTCHKPLYAFNIVRNKIMLRAEGKHWPSCWPSSRCVFCNCFQEAGRWGGLWSVFRSCVNIMYSVYVIDIR